MNALLYWIYVRQTQLLKVEQQQLDNQVQVTALLREIKRRLPRPRPGYLSIWNIRQMPNSRFQFDMGLPPITDPADDTTVRRLAIAINGGAPVVREQSRDDLVSMDVCGAEGQEVGAAFEFSLTDYDSEGNPSEVSSLSFVLTDTVGPPKPGELAVLNMRQLVATPDGLPPSP